MLIQIVKIKYIINQIAAMLAALGSRLIGMSRKMSGEVGLASLTPGQNYINQGINIIQSLPTGSGACAAVALSPAEGNLFIQSKRNSFLLYLNQYDTLQCLRDKDLGRVIKGVFRTVKGEDQCVVEQSFKNTPSMISYRTLINQITIDERRYQSKCATNAENALARWNKKKKKAAEEADKAGEPEQKESAEAVEAVDAAEAAEAVEVAKAVEAEVSPEDMQLANSWMAWFNKMLNVNESCIPKIRRMTPERVRKLIYLGKKYGKAVLEEVVRRAVQKDFYNGRGKNTHFIANIDWLLVEKNFLNVYDDKYY
ncbi:MAG: hypothetical protein IKX44_09180 [Prevotella sp.]|nr:hypothetical protein [Prevotella sp.]